ncbi:DNA-binding IclR family transcriptional regulator [Pseudoclavibacter chungangensis]|nr:IclR family transcriptional regulator [Pseudoclavibacter chungangensis]NYJ66481.1 DNA-binding IclR family transcriptional regulator [Pseudoclavibacter chungangensis]
MASSSIKVLDNVDELLGFLGAHGPRTVPDIARSVSVPRSSVYRLVDAAEHVGLVRTGDDGRVGLAIEMLSLAATAARQNPLVVAAAPILRELRDLLGQSVYLCVRRGDEIVCLLLFQGLSIGLMELLPGGTLPPYAGATARVIVANDPELLASPAAVPSRRLTAATMGTHDELRADVHLVRERGYALSDGDVTPGVAALGVHVRDDTGALLGAISVAGVRDEIMGAFDRSLEALRTASERISAAYRP